MKQLQGCASEILNNPVAEETLLMELFRIIGSASDKDELVLQDVVLFLVERFCGSNMFLRAVAYEQLQSLSQEQNEPLSRLSQSMRGEGTVPSYNNDFEFQSRHFLKN